MRIPRQRRPDRYLAAEPVEPDGACESSIVGEGDIAIEVDGLGYPLAVENEVLAPGWADAWNTAERLSTSLSLSLGHLGHSVQAKDRQLIAAVSHK